MSYIADQLTTELQRTILEDRYARKAPATVPVHSGQIVLVIFPHQRQRATVLSTNPTLDEITVRLHLPSGEAEGDVLTLPRARLDLPIETIDDVMHRVARAIGHPHENKINTYLEMLHNAEFIPGGRILTMAGRKFQTAETAYNCYVINQPKDSRHGIFASLTEMADIMATGGGVGINVSTLRPRYEAVKGVNGRASGAVSWASLFSFVTGLIEQAGSRRGALMVILNDWHPDLEEFIDAKRTAGQITNANISVALSDAFMHAVEHNLDWSLRFPDTSHPRYNAEWTGDLAAYEQTQLPIITHQTRPAREYWNKIVHSAWASAEPGIWFNERSQALSNSYYYTRLIATNPCGEQPLPANAVCNLGAINLARFYNPHTHDVDWDRLHHVVTHAVHFLDDVIDYTSYVNPSVERNQLAERRIGLGSMGIAELFVRLQVRYGSAECLAWIDKLFAFIASTAYRASANLAAQKGAFPLYDSRMLESAYLQHLFTADPSLRQHIVSCGGLRNVTLLTQAPTGTTGTLVNTSTGLEPYFAWSYTRQGRLGMYTEQVPLVQAYFQQHPEAQSLPDYFVTAMELTPQEHVAVQAAFQRWIDSAISKTCNVPSFYTVEQVGELYRLMYDSGCKGGTVYRDGSRDVQVLTTISTPPLKLGNVCPICHQDTLEAEANCLRCVAPDCGYTACEL